MNQNIERQSSRELVLQCSMMEVYVDKVRDLLIGYDFDPNNQKKRHGFMHQTYDSTNLEVYESSNGQMTIKDLSTVNIDN